MLENVIYHEGSLDGKDLFTIDECFSFTTQRVFIEDLVAKANAAIDRGEMSMQEAYDMILCELGLDAVTAKIWSRGHLYGKEIQIRDDNWYVCPV